MINFTLSNTTVNLIVVIGYMAFICINRYSFLKQNKANDKFLYLNIKEANSVVEKFKEKYKATLNIHVIIVSLLLIASIFLSFKITTVVSTVITFLYMIDVLRLNESYINKIKLEQLDKGDKTSQIKWGGLSYFYPSDPKDKKYGLYLGSGFINFAGPFGQWFYYLLGVVVLIAISIAVISNL